MLGQDENCRISLPIPSTFTRRPNHEHAEPLGHREHHRHQGCRGGLALRLACRQRCHPHHHQAGTPRQGTGDSQRLRRFLQLGCRLPPHAERRPAARLALRGLGQLCRPPLHGLHGLMPACPPKPATATCS